MSTIVNRPVLKMSMRVSKISQFFSQSPVKCCIPFAYMSSFAPTMFGVDHICVSECI